MAQSATSPHLSLPELSSYIIVSWFVVVVLLLSFGLVFSQTWPFYMEKDILERTPRKGISFLVPLFVVDVVMSFLFQLLLLLVFTFVVVGGCFLVAFFPLSVYGCCCYYWLNCLLSLVCSLEKNSNFWCCCSYLFINVICDCSCS